MTIAGFSQKISRPFLRIIALTFFGVKVFGLEKFKTETRRQFIIAANHCGRIDSWLVGYFIPRNVFYNSKHIGFMAYDGYMKMFLLGSFLRMWGAYPIAQSTGKPLEETLKTTMEILKNGSSLMIFPEGKIVHDGDKPISRPGVAYLAQKTELPILPVLIKRRRRKFFFSKYAIFFGAPFYCSDVASEDETDLRAIAGKIMDRVYNAGA